MLHWGKQQKRPYLATQHNLISPCKHFVQRKQRVRYLETGTRDKERYNTASTEDEFKQENVIN